MRYFKLFVDELGQADLKSSQSKQYILLGSAIDEEKSNELKMYADQIKFKYWGRTDIVFHSIEISKNNGVFRIFHKNKSKKDEFVKDLFEFLNKSIFVVFAIVCDNEIARKSGWNYNKITKETGKMLFLHFITWLLGLESAKGKVVIESATAEKDSQYLKLFSYFLSPGNKDIPVDYKKIQTILTSISFVTKRNHDIEEQIADLLAYAAKCKYLRISKKDKFKVGSYEDKIIKILDEKLWKLPKEAKEKKMRFYKTIEPFCVVPKT